MLVLAREARKMTQSDLADRIGMSRAAIGKFENGDIGVKDEILDLIAEATNYPVSFFHQDGEMYPEHLVYRKRENVVQSLLTPLNAKINIIRFSIQNILKTLNIESVELPKYEVTGKDTPQVIAQKVRKEWRLKQPVLDSIIDVLESKGIAVASFDFGTERVDSRCVLTDTKYPIIIFNSSLLGDRQRFSITYQLGHLIMHTATQVSWERDVAHESNLFAAEFLMPEEDIRKDFENGVTLSLLGELKLKWKASMISLLYRADDLGILTPNQKRYLIQQFNEQRMRRREPVELDVPVETTTIIKKWMNEVKKQQELNDYEMASLLHLKIEEYIELYY